MITLQQYFQTKPHTVDHSRSAEDLLKRRQALREDYYAAHPGVAVDIDPDTGTEISGANGGSGDGGFRLRGSTTGVGNSSHLDALGVDDSDQKNHFDDWLSTFDKDDGRHNAMLEKHGLYREHPGYTLTWSHLTTRAPKSGKRTFIP